MKKSIAATATILLFCSVASALDDTPENRSMQADRYVAAMPAKEMMNSFVGQAVPKDAPAQQREGLLEQIKCVDAVSLEKAMKEAMTKDFTADELKALADFYGSPAGKSAMKKHYAYLADLMPAIMTEMKKAQVKWMQARMKTMPAEAGDPAQEGEPKHQVPAPQK